MSIWPVLSSSAFHILHHQPKMATALGVQTINCISRDWRTVFVTSEVAPVEILDSTLKWQPRMIAEYYTISCHLQLINTCRWTPTYHITLAIRQVQLHHQYPRKDYRLLPEPPSNCLLRSCSFWFFIAFMIILTWEGTRCVPNYPLITWRFQVSKVATTNQHFQLESVLKHSSKCLVLCSSILISFAYTNITPASFTPKRILPTAKDIRH